MISSVPNGAEVVPYRSRAEPTGLAPPARAGVLDAFQECSTKLVVPRALAPVEYQPERFYSLEAVFDIGVLHVTSP